jgi:hypothetical protein
LLNSVIIFLSAIDVLVLEQGLLQMEFLQSIPIVPS